MKLHLNKLLIAASIMLVSCGNAVDKARDRFVEICESDPKAKSQGFDCSCQADMIKAVLRDNEFPILIKYIELEQKDKAAAKEIRNNPEFQVISRKVSTLAQPMKDKCAANPQNIKPQAGYDEVKLIRASFPVETTN